MKRSPSEITPQKAMDIAATELRQREQPGVVVEVRDFDEADYGGRRPQLVYRDVLNGCWIVYVRKGERLRIESSFIVAIEKQTKGPVCRFSE